MRNLVILFLMQIISFGFQQQQPISIMKCKIEIYNQRQKGDNFVVCLATFDPQIMNKGQKVKFVAHKELKKNDKIWEVRIENHIMLYFPQNLENKFPFLVKLGISNTSLKEIHKEDLKQFPKLQVLHLTDNDLSVIESDLFDYNPEIKEVDLTGNKFSSLPLSLLFKVQRLNGTGFNFYHKNEDSFLTKICTDLKIVEDEKNQKQLNENLQNLTNENEKMSENHEKLKNITFPRTLCSKTNGNSSSEVEKTIKILKTALIILLLVFVITIFIFWQKYSKLKKLTENFIIRNEKNEFKMSDYYRANVRSQEAIDNHIYEEIK